MRDTHELATLPDDELLRRLAQLLHTSRSDEANLVAHIGEADARRLYAREASPSMFAYCTERLHLSEAEAYLRIAVARASREHPVLLEMLADGRLHLTAIAKLAPHLTPENREGLLERATHRTKRETEELLAAVAPRPYAPALIRKVPEKRTKAAAAPSAAQGPALSSVAARPPDSNQGVCPASEHDQHADPAVLEPPPSGAASHAFELRPDAVRLDGSSRPAEQELGRGADARPDHPAAGHARAASVEPLSPARYRVQFTAPAELRDKLERLQALMRSSIPDGDLAAIIEQAVTEKLERLEARRFARTKASRKASPPGSTSLSGRGPSPTARGGSPATAEGSASARGTSSRTRHIPAAIRRAVYERDEGRCRYVDERGRRCTARDGLEYHHRHPFGHGGRHSIEGVSLLCRVHNLFLAEVDYGRGAMVRHRRSKTESQSLGLGT